MASKKIKVLVLLATYNGAPYIKDLLLSILNQEGVDLNILISDDGSSDSTIKTINNFINKYNNIKVISNSIKTNSHSGNFYNLFINSNLNGFDYVAFSDQDDLFLSNKFLVSAQTLRQSISDGLSSSVRCFGDSKSILSQSSKITKYDFLFEGAGQGCTFFLKTSVFNEFQKFIKQNLPFIKDFFFHDWLVYIFVRANNKKWYFSNDILTLYRIHSKNTVGNKFSFQGLFTRFSKITNGWYFNQVMMANAIALKINRNIPDFSQLSLSQIFILLVLNGRRKLHERLIAILCIFPFLIICRVRNQI